MQLFMVTFVAFLEHIEMQMKFDDRVSNSGYRTRVVECLANRDGARYLFHCVY